MSSDKTRSKGRARARTQKADRARRPVLVVFAVLLGGLFAGFAVAQGIGKPDVPPGAIAVVEDVPGARSVTDCKGAEVEDDFGTITEAELDCALEQTASRAGLPRVPKPGAPRYTDVRDAALGDLLDAAWIRGEAAAQGITASQREIDDQLQQLVGQGFNCPANRDPFQCKELQRFIESSRFSEDDVTLRVELQVLSEQLQAGIGRSTSQVTPEEVEAYYEDAQDQFTQPASRDVRLVLNRDRAKIEEAKSRLQQDNSVAGWRKVATQLSTDPVSRNSGGLREGITEGLLEEPLNGEVFSAAQEEIVGPVQTPLGFYVFEVVGSTPERVQPLGEVQARIRDQLSQAAQQEAFSGFVDDYGSRWQSRTVCVEPFIIERCSNFVGDGKPENSPPGCFEENPRGGTPDACPAPVLQTAPALPGTVRAISPQGMRLAQRPRPLGLEPAAQPGLPGGGGGGPVPLAP